MQEEKGITDGAGEKRRRCWQKGECPADQAEAGEVVRCGRREEHVVEQGTSGKFQRIEKALQNICCRRSVQDFFAFGTREVNFLNQKAFNRRRG